MAEQLKLLEIEESYNLNNLRNICSEFVKKKFPCPVEDEEFDDYLQMIQDEADLEFAARLRKIADDIENRILNPMRKEIKEVYKDLTNDKKNYIIK